MQNQNVDNKRALTVRRTGQRDGFIQTIKEIIDYREMIKAFVRRDLRGRYKGSCLVFLLNFFKPASAAVCVQYSFFNYT